MDHNHLQSLAGLPQRMGRAQAVLAQAVKAGSAVREGTDPSGSITVIINDAGDARDIWVAPDWRRRLPSGEVGAAVLAADRLAAQRRAHETVAALEPLTASTTAAADSTVDDVGHLPGRLGQASPATSPHRSLTELTAAVWAAFDDLDRVTAPPPPVQGESLGGAVRVTLAHGRITECAIDALWLTRQDDTTLAHALREALSAAGRLAGHAQQPLHSYQSHLDDLLAETMAHLAPDTSGRTVRSENDAAHR